MSIISVDDVKTELCVVTTSDMTPYLQYLGATEEARNAAIEANIERAIAQAERELKSDIRTKVIKCYPDSSLVKGWEEDADYQIEEEPYDFYKTDYQAFGWLTLRRRPVQSVERVILRYGVNLEILEYPAEWIRVQRKFGRLQILPTAGAWGQAGPLMSAGGYFLLPMMMGWVRDVVPQLICVDYTTGIENCESDPEFAELRHMITKLAAEECLLQMGRGYKAGLGGYSIGEDGASESIQLTRGGGVLFGGEIQIIQQDWQRFVKSWFETQMPIQFTAL